MESVPTDPFWTSRIQSGQQHHSEGAANDTVCNKSGPVRHTDHGKERTVHRTLPPPKGHRRGKQRGIRWQGRQHSQGAYGLQTLGAALLIDVLSPESPSTTDKSCPLNPKMHGLKLRKP